MLLGNFLKPQDMLNFYFRLFPKKFDLQALMRYYDTDQDGNISYEEFIRGLR